MRQTYSVREIIKSKTYNQKVRGVTKRWLSYEQMRMSLWFHFNAGGSIAPDEKEDDVQPDWYYEVGVGIVRFPEGKAERFQAYKALQGGYGIYLKDIISSGGFERPYYVDTYVLVCNDESKWKYIEDLETSMEGKWNWFDRATLDIHIKMLKDLEALGCKMIYMSRSLSEHKMPLVERIPEEYFEDFTFNIDWFKMLVE